MALLGTQPWRPWSSCAKRLRFAMLATLVLGSMTMVKRHGTRPCLVAEMSKEFLSFESLLRQRGAVLDGTKAMQVSDRSAGLGVAVFAQKCFKEGELVLRVPSSMCLQIPLVASPAVPAAQLAKKLLEERSRGAASTFSEYIQLLPALPSLHPLRHEWPEDMLCGSLRKFYMEAKPYFQGTGTSASAAA
ncbi:unnamed protein product [Durusdinium trenchii]|uniref:Uncharacterized protein n=1 Tax=Durusdinium trenchii TaxID=1381693 RepID=A0ABP0HS73_9DINO